MRRISRVPQLRPTFTELPVITGDFIEGQTLSVTTGTATASAGGGIVNYTFQWYRGSTAISGADSQNYVATESDVGSQVGCDVTATDTNGFRTVSATGADVVVFANAAPSATLNVNLSSRTVTAWLTSITGYPVPVPTLNTFTADGSDVSGSVTGSGTLADPWTYTQASSESGTAIVVGASLDNGVAPAWSDTDNSITISANLVAPSVATPVSINDLTPSVEQTVTITWATFNGSPVPNVTNTLTLNGVDVTADMVGQNYTVPVGSESQDLIATSVGSNGVGSDATSTATATVESGVAAVAPFIIDFPNADGEDTFTFDPGSGAELTVEVEIGGVQDSISSFTPMETIDVREQKAATFTRTGDQPGDTITVFEPQLINTVGPGITSSYEWYLGEAPNEEATGNTTRTFTYQNDSRLLRWRKQVFNGETLIFDKFYEALQPVIVPTAPNVEDTTISVLANGTYTKNVLLLDENGESDDIVTEIRLNGTPISTDAWTSNGELTFTIGSETLVYSVDVQSPTGGTATFTYTIQGVSGTLFVTGRTQLEDVLRDENLFIKTFPGEGDTSTDALTLQNNPDSPAGNAFLIWDGPTGEYTVGLRIRDDVDGMNSSVTFSENGTPVEVIALPSLANAFYTHEFTTTLTNGASYTLTLDAQRETTTNDPAWTPVDWINVAEVVPAYTMTDIILSSPRYADTGVGVNLGGSDASRVVFVARGVCTSNTFTSLMHGDIVDNNWSFLWGGSPAGTLQARLNGGGYGLGSATPGTAFAVYWMAEPDGLGNLTLNGGLILPGGAWADIAPLTVTGITAVDLTQRSRIGRPGSANYWARPFQLAGLWTPTTLPTVSNLKNAIISDASTLALKDPAGITTLLGVNPVSLLHTKDANGHPIQSGTGALYSPDPSTPWT